MEKVSIICGTNRVGSNTSIVAHSIYELIKAKNKSSVYLNIKDLPADFAFNNEIMGQSSAALDGIIENHVASATHFIFVLPEYNGSFPGVAKSLLDSFSPKKIHNKRAFLVGVSSGRAGNLRGLEHFTGILNYLRVHVFPFKMAIDQVDKKIDYTQNNFNDEHSLRFLNESIDQFLSL